VIDPDCHVFVLTKFGASMLRLCNTDKCSSLIAKAVKCNLGMNVRYYLFADPRDSPEHVKGANKIAEPAVVVDFI
jgi:hypothetical protein